MMDRQVSFFGLGYVGLTTAACMAYKGIRTIGYDVDEERLKRIEDGEPPIYEPGLSDILVKVVKTGMLKVAYSPEEAVSLSDLTFITVGTPMNEDGSADLTYVKIAAEQIGRALRGKGRYHVVVVKSTVPPGTTAGIIRPILEGESGMSCGEGFGLCVNPEFLREGRAIEDTLRPDRIVIGRVDDRSGEELLELYKHIYGQEIPPHILTSSTNAELIKYANNAFLAMKISFINTIARLCEKLSGGDVEVIARGIGMDKRIGPLFLEAGIGWGGSCLPKDLKALINACKTHGVEPHLMEATIRVNDEQLLHIVHLLESKLGGLAEKKIAILGLAFKEGTDDVRESQAMKLAMILSRRGAEVRVYDPKAMRNAERVLRGSVSYLESWRSCVKGADAAVIATPWSEFREIGPLDVANLMRRPVIIDARRVLDWSMFKEAGVDVYVIGKGPP